MYGVIDKQSSTYNTDKAGFEFFLWNISPYHLIYEKGVIILIPWLIGAIFGYLLGGPFIAVPIVIIGIIFIATTNLMKSLKQPTFLIALIAFLLNMGILWVIGWLFNWSAESLPWQLGLTVMFAPSIIASISYELKYGKSFFNKNPEH